MRLLRPLPRKLTRPLSWLGVCAWLLTMGTLLREEFLRAAPLSLGTDLSRFGSSATWKGVYYRGEKIGFMVGQTLPQGDGYELQEEGQLQITLMGMGTAAKIRTSVRVDAAYSLRGFDFSLDPGTGAVKVKGELQGKSLQLEVTTPGGTRRETRELADVPVLGLNLPRRLATEGLETGKRFDISVFDPATLSNAPMTIEVKEREIVRAAGRPTPAFRLETRFAGIQATTWITDVGEVVKEESPMGLVVVKETQERATAMAMSREIRADMIEAAAIQPEGKSKIDDPTQIDYLELKITTPSPITGPDLQGAGQVVNGDVFELRDSSKTPLERAGDHARWLAPERLIESDAPEIRAEAEKAVAGVQGTRARAERLVRHVNALLEKKPTVSLPSALEVLRTRVGDCNEHTALYVAMARSLGLPARIAVGLVSLRGAFYYHAWPEVWVEETAGRGRWIAVDPTLNQFPADLSHVRLARGGLEQQTAILPLVGQTKIAVLEMQMAEGAVPMLVGQEASAQARPIEMTLPSRLGGPKSCWVRPGSGR
ncbi:MAG: transglutaminase-like domain-containing protein [Vicinamibacteria bacterium]|nr:transglutaminase-like domain-containing protein [Vicinamibacteria bacterium]